ncbi:MAG: bis(5'-nucleosyl)-tetraphosphatase (symmetrical) YqeK [Dehalococcoidia bacterium]
MDEASRSRIFRAIERLPRGVQTHIEAVRRRSIELALRFGLDQARAELAAQTHDVCRTVKGPDLLAMAREFALPVTVIERAFPVFLHGPVGAEVLKRDYGLDDQEVLSAVRCHTMGKPGMSGLDKVLFLADKLEPSKTGRYPFIREVDRLADDDLDRALLCFIDHQVEAFFQEGSLVHPAMIAARNDAVLALRGSGKP